MLGCPCPKTRASCDPLLALALPPYSLLGILTDLEIVQALPSPQLPNVPTVIRDHTGSESTCTCIVDSRSGEEGSVFREGIYIHKIDMYIEVRE